METNVLFIKTVEDIEARLSQTDPYEILLIAGLLRKLFLDDHPLVDQVNKFHRVRFEFDVTVPVNMPDDGDTNSLWLMQDGLDPDTAPPGKTRAKLSREQFFQTVVAMSYGPSHTVRDVIKFEANIGGAVHAGAPVTEKEKALATIANAMRVGGYEPILRQLLAIARVSLKALAPLRAAVDAA